MTVTMDQDAMATATALNGGSLESVDICVCTFQRPDLEETLRSLLAQDAPDLKLRIVVADNDVEPSAEPLVRRVADGSAIPIAYVHAPSRNISLARNACLDEANADWVAFIDDDETAPAGWIAALHGAAVVEARDVVFGPVHAIYPDDAPDWIVEGDYHSTRAPVHGGVVSTGHSGNVLIRWGDRPWTGERFLLEKGRTGGEDVEFFFRLSRAGLSLGVCEEAAAYEGAPPQRLTYRWVLRRRFLAGQFHGAHSGPTADPSAAWFAHRAKLLAGSGLKMVYCALRSLPGPGAARRRWMIRSAFHAGVCRGALGLPQGNQY